MWVGQAFHLMILPRSLMQLCRVSWTRRPKRTSHTEISWYHCCGQGCLSLLQWRILQQDSLYSGLRAVDHKDEKWKLQGLLWPKLWNSLYILLAKAYDKASQVQGCAEMDRGWEEWKSHIAKWNVYQGRRNYGQLNMLSPKTKGGRKTTGCTDTKSMESWTKAP